MDKKPSKQRVTYTKRVDVWVTPQQREKLVALFGSKGVSKGIREAIDAMPEPTHTKGNTLDN